MKNELDYFARCAGDNPLREWLEAQKTEAIKYLRDASDPVMIHRAQGKLQLVERMLDNLDKAKNLR